MMTTPNDQKERFHFLDGLRGIAASMIVVHHLFTSNIVNALEKMHMGKLGELFMNFTQSGVELFFVLSGIVLLRPYLRKQRKLKVGDYFYRRVKRIYPPYFFALLFGVAVMWVIKTYPTWYSELFKWTEISFRQFFKQAMIISFDGAFYNLAWWSLGIEILFYILVPVVIFTFPAREKVTTIGMWLMLAGTFIISVMLQLWLTNSYPDIYNYKHITSTIYQAVCYPVCFLLGILLAAKDLKVNDGKAFMGVGLILVLGSLCYMPIVNAGYGFLYAGFIILAFNRQAIKHFLSKPGMIWLGERSYSLFLVHFSVFYLSNYMVSHITPDRNIYYGVITRIMGIPLALFAAMLLFHFVERKQARGLVTANMFWPWQVRHINKMDQEP